MGMSQLFLNRRIGVDFTYSANKYRAFWRIQTTFAQDDSPDIKVFDSMRNEILRKC